MMACNWAGVAQIDRLVLSATEARLLFSTMYSRGIDMGPMVPTTVILLTLAGGVGEEVVVTGGTVAVGLAVVAVVVALEQELIRTVVRTARVNKKSEIPFIVSSR
jgi:NADPH:quinone reductase-like Zn-dependent oxidoreductase